jgi:hypothetical protein
MGGVGLKTPTAQNQYMKIALRFLFVLLLVGLTYGTYHKNSIDIAQGDKIIGFSVLFAVLVFLPLFLYHRWKGKRLKDYTLSEENLKKMYKNIENQSISNKKSKKTQG